MKNLYLGLIAVTLSVVAPIRALAMGNEEVSIVPIGDYAVEQGWHDVSYPLAQGVKGPLANALVIVAAQGFVERDEVPLDPAAQEDPFTPPVVTPPVPGTIKIKLGDRELPEWVLEPKRTAYVIGWDHLRKNPAFKASSLSLSISLEGESKAIKVSILAVPDVGRLAGDVGQAFAGPLRSFIESLESGSVREYFTAFAAEVSGDSAAAKAGYGKLATDLSPQVARFARRGLRMIEYFERPHKLSGNIVEHFRWGLYLQLAGLFGPALNEFEEARIVSPAHHESQFRGGETLERLGGDTLKTVHYFNRSVESLPYQNPTIWSALVVIVKSRGAKTLTPDQLIVIKDQFIILDRILWAASHGAFRLNVSFFEIEKEEAQTMTRHLGRVTGPPDDLIEKRGWYDVVFCVRPRIEGEDRDALETGWSDVGPNGAALATFFSDASFSTYLRAIYQHIFNAADARGETLGWPNSAGALHCGFQPARFAGSAYRSALRYHLSPGEIAGLAIADEPVELSYLKLWRLEGPVTPVDGEPESRLDDRWPESASAASKNMVSESNFIDLAAHFENAGPAKVRATSSVFCPERRDVWVRLGRNDRASLWINGRGAIATKSIAGTKFEGRNLVDTVFTRATLEAGWNEFQLIVASRPSEKNKGWGFSVAITTPGKSAVPGLACTYETPGERLAPRYVAPAIGRHYSWKSVQADFHNLLPRLGDTELAQITSVADARLHRGEIREAPFIAVESASRKEGGAYRSPSTFDESGHHDLVLNNVLDWSREAVAAFRGGEAGRGRDLLFVRGEAIEAATSILKEHESAKGTFEGKTAADRLLGWIDFAPYGTVFVLDVRLPDEWPADEEEIFTPYGKFVPNWPDEFLEGPPYVPPVSEVPQ